MSERQAEQIVLVSRPNGPPTPENFRLEKAAMPALPAGGVLVRVLYLSLDPYMRGRMSDAKSYAAPVGLGEVMGGESVCQIIASDRKGYAIGDIVLASTGWRTHAAIEGSVSMRKLDPKLAPITTGLGVLGMPGFTAYAGLVVLGKPKPGETVVVIGCGGVGSGAPADAGGVGSGLNAASISFFALAIGSKLAMSLTDDAISSACFFRSAISASRSAS